MLIDIERRRAELPPAWLAEQVGIAAITAAELLAGVFRADPARRPRRTAFVEGVLNLLPVLPFDLVAARLFAQVEFELARVGVTVDTADLQIAATALARGWDVATLNAADFARVPGLGVRTPADRDT